MQCKGCNSIPGCKARGSMHLTARWTQARYLKMEAVPFYSPVTQGDLLHIVMLSKSPHTSDATWEVLNCSIVCCSQLSWSKLQASEFSVYCLHNNFFKNLLCA